MQLRKVRQDGQRTLSKVAARRYQRWACLCRKRLSEREDEQVLCKPETLCLRYFKSLAIECLKMSQKGRFIDDLCKLPKMELDRVE